MKTTEKRSTDLLHDALCRIRLLAQQPGEGAQEAIYHIADAAHNIPLALGGHHVYQKYLEEDLARLEVLVRKTMADSIGRTVPKLPWWKRLAG